VRVILAIALSVVCWGLYGPTIHHGQALMGGSRLRPFICVGLAYFIIAVVIPALLLRIRGETGRWTIFGSVWSLAAGAAGAIGALGVIFAMTFGGTPIFVMPLIFGGAPVVNSFITIFLNRSYRYVGSAFGAGLVMVIVGAFTVLVTRHGLKFFQFDTLSNLPWVLLSTAVVICFWGSYGPLLHKGQLAMRGSRLRPFMCVGLSYFLIAVAVPLTFVGSMEPAAEVADAGAATDAAEEETAATGATWTVGGVAWSMAAGAAGAFVAMGIILAFTLGGRPIYVMPLVFGGAPLINTFAEFVTRPGSELPDNPLFYAGLILVAAGAVLVLIFAPRHPPAQIIEKKVAAKAGESAPV